MIKELNLSRLPDYPLVSVDVETTGLSWKKDRLFGVAVAAHDPDTKEWASGYWDVRTNSNIVPWLIKLLPQCRRVMGHNLKFDALFARCKGIEFPADRMECTMVRAALINEHEPSFSLDALARKYVGQGKVDIYGDLAKLFGGEPTRKAQMGNLHRAPERLARKYAIEDPQLAIKLWLWQEKQIAEQELERVWAVERALTPVLVDLEWGGVRVDLDRTHRELALTKDRIQRAQSALNAMVGQEFNANSPPQMRKLFNVKKGEDDRWWADNGVLLDDTPGGEGSFSKIKLKLMADRGDKRAQAVIDVRTLVKASSFLKDHILGHEVNGYVHPNYNQTRGDNELGTGTGRFSVNDPALQQIPKRDKEIALITRACFVPDEGQDWCCADWEQFEFRWFAHYVNDPALIAKYRDDPATDFHAMVAAITGLPRDAKYAGNTANAKQINLGLVFGMGEGKLAEEMDLEFSIRHDRSGREWLVAGPEAKAKFEQYHSAIPGIRQLLDQAASIARGRGYVKTMLGRRIRFPSPAHAYKAGGLVFQGTSADCMKQKMIELHATHKKQGFRMLLSVHDEIDFSVPRGKKHVPRAIKYILEDFGPHAAISCRVPILSDVRIADHWAGASLS